MNRKSRDKIVRRWGETLPRQSISVVTMEQQKDVNEASVKVACVSPMHFYSLLVKGGTS
jgi:hypothetical protein